MAEAYLNLGSVVAELGEFEEAAAAYARGLRMREWDARTAAASYNNLGAALRELGRHDEAERHFAMAVARNPELVVSGEDNPELNAILLADAIMGDKPAENSKSQVLAEMLVMQRGSKVMLNLGQKEDL